LSTSSPNSRGVALAVGALVLLGVGFGLALLWIGELEGFAAGGIFFLHVPIALTAYALLGWGAWKALRLLWTRDERYDLESYTGIHVGVIFALLTLVTGSIWARAEWLVWWEWRDRQLVTFLILFLFYSAYFMLRYSLEPGPARMRISAVYALLGVVLIPVSFLAVRLAEQFLHRTPLIRRGAPDIEGSVLAVFGVCLAGMLALAAAMYAIELAGKRLDARLREAQ
jgi:heme exporter protein C